MRIDFSLGSLNTNKGNVKGLELSLDYHVNEVIQVTETILTEVVEMLKEEK